MGVGPVTGTVFIMPYGASCHDLNLSFVGTNDEYEGLLLNGGTCQCGFIPINAGRQNTSDPPVLCTDVLPSTEMIVTELGPLRAADHRRGLIPPQPYGREFPGSVNTAKDRETRLASGMFVSCILALSPSW